MSAAEYPLRKLLEAIAFASRRHYRQLRKDNETPYVSHAYRVCLTVRHVFNVADLAVLTAAVLHDTIEDTTTDYDDLAEQFGSQIADWVQALSKDKRLPHDPREEKYKAVLAAAPWQVQVCKLADIHDNLTDSVHTRPDMQARTRRRAQEYLEALKSHLQPEARPAFEVVSRLLIGMATGF